MAIKKDIENEYGADFNYHKIKKVTIENDEKNGIILNMEVYSYKDKEARISGKMPTVKNCIIYGADFAMQPFYALLKAKFPSYSSGKDDHDNSFKEAEGGKMDPVFYETNKTGLLNRWTEEETEEDQEEENGN